MKRILLLTFILLVCIPVAAMAEFWASKNSNKYHYPSCRSAQRIKPANLIKFKTAQEAINAGYVSCKVCRPPSK